MDEIILDAEEQRVLGALLEKQKTVPSTYPMTLNALRTACNQQNSRDPVVSYDGQTVEQTAKRLKDRGLLRIVWADRGPRTLKYHQLLDEVLGLQPDERALVTVLLLRGAQAPGELKTRTDRLHPFEDRDRVEHVLRRMAALPTPLVAELPRRSGDKDHRWIHLLGPVAAAEVPGAAGASPGAPAADREGVLAEGAAARDARVVASYDVAAETYADRVTDELEHLLLDRWLLGRVAALAGARPVLDVGCGPGHIAHHLQQAGADVTALDLSPGMVAQARELFPSLRVSVGDQRDLMRPPAAPGWGAITSWFSLVHSAESELVPTIAGFARVLDHDGWLAVGYLAGDQVRDITSLWGLDVDVTIVEHGREVLLAALAAAGLTDVEWYERGVYPLEFGSAARGYVLARKP